MQSWWDYRHVPNILLVHYADALYAPGGGAFSKGGAETFLHKGTNGRWRDVLPADELAQYDAACARALTPECRDWARARAPCARRGRRAP